MFDSQLYRDKQEIQAWQEKGPIVQLSHWLRNNKQITVQQIQQIEPQVDKEIEQAINSALKGCDEPVSDLLKHVYAEVNYD